MGSREHLGSATFRAYQTSPSGDGRPNSVTFYGTGRTTDSDVYRVGIYGWRKRCLYCLILLLIVVIVINLSITIWIMRVLDFNMEGMGSLKILDNGIRVVGHSEFEKPVSFHNMTSSVDAPFIVDSHRGVAITARTKLDNTTTRLTMENGEIKAFCNHFEISTSRGKRLFYANKDEVGVKVENLRIISDTGSIFDGSVQTSLIRPDTGSELRLESPTRGLNATAAQDVEILSRAGDIKAEALHNIYLESGIGEIHFNSPNIFVSRVMEGVDSGRGVKDQLQVCLCSNGRMFLARPAADCRSTPEICK